MNLNPRYPHYHQMIRTAGDHQQFIDWAAPSSEAFSTFLYIFNNFRKGIYCRINHAKIDAYVPFDKAHFVNNYFNEYIRMLDTTEPEQTINELTGEKNCRPVYTWTANGTIFRYERMTHVIDPCADVFYDFCKEIASKLDTGCYEFFINRRDYPILCKDRSEPYVDVFHVSTPTTFSPPEIHVPIFSMTNTPEMDDVCIPTWEDWARASLHEHAKIFAFCDPGDVQCEYSVPWDQKINKCVFRGASTGKGHDHHTNIRIKAMFISSQNPEILDAGITKWNRRPRCDSQHVYTISNTYSETKHRLNYNEQQHYKYLLNLPGHVSAFRLPQLLRMNSVVLHVQSKYTCWFESELQPYIHYIPVANDLSDLISQIQWCIANDEKCQTIAKNAFEFYKAHLTSTAMIKYTVDQIRLNCIKTTNMEKGERYHDIVPLQLSRKLISMRLGTSTRFYQNRLRDMHMYKYFKSKYHALHEIHIGLDLPNNNHFRKYYPEVYVYKSKYYAETVFEDSMSLHEFILDLKRTGKSIAYLLQMLRQICHIYSEAYTDVGFVHNDAYPWNILVQNGYSESPMIKIVDYDKSRTLNHSYTDLHSDTIFPTKDIFTLLVVVCDHMFHYKPWRKYGHVLVQHLFSDIYSPSKCNSYWKECCSTFRKYDVSSSLTLNRIPNNLTEPSQYMHILDILLTCE